MLKLKRRKPIILVAWTTVITTVGLVLAGMESFSSSSSLKLTPEASLTAAHSECNHPEVQNQVEELFRAMEDQGVDVVSEPKVVPSLCSSQWLAPISRC